jgi:Nucleotidyl transferase AbiEii toxin, Type IV TA system
MTAQGFSPDLPFLKAICWQSAEIDHFSPLEQLRRYEQGWVYRGLLGDLNSDELDYVRSLADRYGSWLSSVTEMFVQDYHQLILTVLRHLNAEFFQRCQAYFGGGTLISLKYGEYRLSKDIDFICPMGDSYRLLRRSIFDHGYDALLTDREDIHLPADLQTSQYAVRFAVVVADTAIKVEIVAEDRIILGEPDYPTWSPVACLNETDCFAEKLLANSDRWADTSIESRDLIDLAMLRFHTDLPVDAITKAEAAYPVIEPLKRSIRTFQAKPEYRLRCYKSLRITEPATIINGLDRLAIDFDLETTDRISEEIEAQDGASTNAHAD